MRGRADLTYDKLAAKTGLAATTLRLAASGTRLPTWDVTRAFARACDCEHATVRALWADACRAAGRSVPAEPPAEPPDPAEAKSAVQLIGMLKQLRLWAAEPSLAELNRRAGGHNILPPSTVHDMLNKERFPRLELMLAFVRACGLDDDQAAVWQAAWERIEAKEDDALAAAAPPSEAQLGQVLQAKPEPEPLIRDYVQRVARHTWARNYLRSVAIVDLGCAEVSVFIAAWVRFGSNVTPAYTALSLALPVFWLGALLLAGAYDARFIGTGSDEFRKVLNAGVGLAAAVGLFFYMVSLPLSRGYFVIALAGITLFDLVARYWMRVRLHRQRASGKYMHSVVAVGRAWAIADLVTELKRDRYHGLTVVGACVTQPGQSDEVAGVPVFGGLDDITAAVMAYSADTVAVTVCPEMDGIRLRSLAWELEKTGTDLCVSPSLLDVAGPRTTIRPTAGLSLLHVDHPQLDGFRLALKGLFDRAVAAAALLTFAPVFTVLAVAIWLDDRGPALFTQIRVGKDGRTFRMYKFRTMAVNAEQRHPESLSIDDDFGGVPFIMRKDPRITAVGEHLRRWSIDELPQLINVFLGHMSLVGPRPALVEEAEKYAEHVRRRLVTKPGVTGLWQVNRRSDLSWDESVRLDLRYVENWSFALDMQILWKTISMLIRGSGAY
jgi:exopolysaccharide biosynthesis polyprenyl glycosylphosphotransferase